MKSLAIRLSLLLAALPTSCKPERTASGAQSINFNLLLMTVCEDNGNGIFPGKLKLLDGRRISLSGFMAAYEDPGKMSKMLLTKSSLSCFYCNPPEANGVVLVRLSKQENPLEMEDSNVTIEGTLHLIGLDCQDPEAKQFLYTIDEAKITKSSN